MVEALRVVRADTPLRVAGALVAEAVKAAGRAPRLAIPGGSALAALGPARAELGGAWSRVRLTWVDERCVPYADPASNRGAAYRRGWLEAARPSAEELPLFCDGEDPAQAVARVEVALDKRFEGGLDVLLLGLGEDGHIASLFPGRIAGRGRVAYVPASPKPPPQRITLTRPVLATARCAVCLAAGEAKRDAAQRLARGDPELPAHGLPGLVLVTDLDLGEET